MSGSSVAEAADGNLATHFSWAQKRTEGMHTDDDLGLVRVDCGMPCDTFNAVCHCRLDSTEAPRRIRQAIDWFAELGHPFSWWVGPADRPENLGTLLRDAGLEQDESELAMAADLEIIRQDPVPEGLEIRRAGTLEELMDFARINAANWSPPDEDVVHFYERTSPVLLSADSPLRYYVGYLDGRPVAASELTVGGGVVGLYSISTLAAYRRRGLGTALTVRPLLDARNEGHRTAILQAADEGIGLYRRVGFETFGQITEYKPPGN